MHGHAGTFVKSMPKHNSAGHEKTHQTMSRVGFFTEPVSATAETRQYLKLTAAERW
jgi:hypothetical protein